MHAVETVKRMTQDGIKTYHKKHLHEGSLVLWIILVFGLVSEYLVTSPHGHKEFLRR